MASFRKFNAFVADLANQVHDLSSDQITVALTAAADAPVAANAVLADLTEIDYTNLSTRDVTTVSSTQSGGLYKLVLTDLVLTASGGPVATFRYIVLYNSTVGAGPLIGFFDYGSNVALADGDTFTIDFSATNGVLTLQ